MKALSLGHTRAQPHPLLLHLSRATLVKKEGDFDQFRIMPSRRSSKISMNTLNSTMSFCSFRPVFRAPLSPEELAALEALDLDELRQKFEERLRSKTNDTMGVIAGSGPVGHHRSDTAGRIRLGCASGGIWPVPQCLFQIAMDRRF